MSLLNAGSTSADIRLSINIREFRHGASDRKLRSRRADDQAPNLVDLIVQTPQLGCEMLGRPVLHVLRGYRWRRGGYRRNDARDRWRFPSHSENYLVATALELIRRRLARIEEHGLMA